ncbi:SIMPL domain-containing protein [Bacillus salipaludis]|uniref:SIMPL domain-containing protein n=1 Tax=Bacillus salipaludis TaxID=2547811 RepID=UPI002E1E20E5|nr:SIMPL domain-containing protein [Bacillus salipaludis]MED1468192.1 SIMPL domain-containing protein [Bacillus salipaludis]
MYRYQQPERIGKNHVIKVTGEGELAVQPDIANVNLGVMTENRVLMEAQQQNSEAVNKLIQSLLSLGVPQKNLQTFDYRIDSEYDFDQGKQTFRAYKVTYILKVKLEDLTSIGRVIDTAVQNGANYVANVQFSLKNQDGIYQKALSLALTKAIEKAKTIANTLRVTLNPTPNLVIEGGTLPPSILNPQMTYVKGISSTQFEPGELIVKATISAEFEY